MKSCTINLPYYFNKDFVVCKFPQILGASLRGRGRLNDTVAFKRMGTSFAPRFLKEVVRGEEGILFKR